MTPTVEHPVDSTGKAAVSQERGEESGALGSEIGPELAEVVRAWPTLPGDVRARIVAAVRHAGKGAEQ